MKTAEKHLSVTAAKVSVKSTRKLARELPKRVRQSRELPPKPTSSPVLGRPISVEHKILKPFLPMNVLNTYNRARVSQCDPNHAMRRRKCPVLIEMDLQRLPAGINAPPRARPVEVSLALRERGWSPCRVWFDAGEGAWVASVIYRAGTTPRHR